MSDQPCRNPNCNSYGHPHPNCKCYDEMSEGGAVGFCEKKQDHKPNCKYFSSGGEAELEEVPAEDLPADEPIAAAPIVEAAPVDLEPVPPEDMALEEVPEEDLQGEPGEMSLPSSVEDAKARLRGPGLLRTPEPTPEEGTKLTDEDLKHPAGPGGLPGPMGGIGAVGIAQNVAKTAGQAFLRGAIANGMIQGGDEVEKWALGQGDPHDAVGAALARVGISSALGGIFGVTGRGAQKGTEKALSAAAEGKIGQQAEYFFYGLASAAKKGKALGEDAAALPGAAAKGFKAGQEFYKVITNKYVPFLAGSGGAGAGAIKGYQEDGLTGALEGAAGGFLKGIATHYVGKTVGVVSAKVLAPAVLNILRRGGLHGVTEALDHVLESAQGYNAVNKTVENVLSGTLGSSKALEAYGSEKTRQKIKDWLEEGGLIQSTQDQMGAEPQNFAKGGHVEEVNTDHQHDGVAMHYPEQNHIMNAAKGRMFNYLNSMRPEKHAPKLAFDDEPDTKEQEKAYNKAIDIAAQPLGIMHEVHNGTLEPEQVKHFKALHPEVNGLLQKKIMEQITKQQMDGKKPSYKVRQGLSLLMGTPLSGEMTQANIQAAQQTFAQRKEESSSPPEGPKPNTSKLSKSDRSFLTDDQARAKRQQRVS